MDNANAPFFELLCLFVIYIMFPLLPTVVIFKLFPDTNLNLRGPLQALTLNATGAFAGYIVCCLIGWGIVNNIMESVKQAQDENYVWLVKAKINLLDSDNKTPLEADVAQQDMENFKQEMVHIVPDIIRTENNGLKFYMPEQLMRQEADINISLPGFMPTTIVQSDMDKAKTGHGNLIDLGTINLKRSGRPSYQITDTLKKVSAIPN